VENEGWGWPGRASEGHYFVGGRSLCGRWLYDGEVDEGDYEGWSRCAVCRRKLAKRLEVRAKALAE